MKSPEHTDAEADRPADASHETDGKRWLTAQEIFEKWADVFPPEFWEDVRNARDVSPRKERE